jgi:hypothetical protein
VFPHVLMKQAWPFESLRYKGGGVAPVVAAAADIHTDPPLGIGLVFTTAGSARKNRAEDFRRKFPKPRANPLSWTKDDISCERGDE